MKLVYIKRQIYLNLHLIRKHTYKLLYLHTHIYTLVLNIFRLKISGQLRELSHLVLIDIKIRKYCSIIKVNGFGGVGVLGF